MLFKNDLKLSIGSEINSNSWPCIDKRSRISVTIDPSKTDKSLVLESNQFKGHKKTITHKTSVLALNEITVDSGVFSKDIKLEIYLNDAFLKEY